MGFWALGFGVCGLGFAVWGVWDLGLRLKITRCLYYPRLFKMVSTPGVLKLYFPFCAPFFLNQRKYFRVLNLINPVKFSPLRKT